MKKCLPIFHLLALASGLSAQITVTNATFPVAGDTLRFAVDNTPGTIGSLTPPGPQDWDFTSLSADATQTIVYRPAIGGAVGAMVPGAELYAVLSPGTETYYNVTDTKFELQAYYGIVPYDLIANNIFEYLPLLPERHAPLNFFDINASSTGFIELFVPADFSPLLILQLAALTNNAQIDSMRYRVAISGTDVVDAYGSMSIPGGTFDVLREKRSQYQETRLDAKVPPLGWLDITDNAIQAGFFGLGVDTTVSYYFHNDVAKEPIAIVTLDNNQAFATQIMYKNTAPVFNASIEEKGTVPTASVSPNPVHNDAVFAIKNLAPGHYRLAIFDATGRTAMEKSLLQLSGGHTARVDFSHLAAGVYFVVLFDKNSKVSCREKLVKR